MAKRTQSPKTATALLLCGAGAFVLWRLLTPASERDREFSVVDGRDYEFTLVAHPYGNATEWWEAAEAALSESGAHSITVLSRTPSDVVVRFVKRSPITTMIKKHAVLYPNDPPLATATMLDCKPAKGGVLPLGGSASV